jgi:hypothetical protein
MIPTADPLIEIEKQSPGFVRYRHVDGRRWEVHGVCDRRGDCLIGAVLETPGGPVTVRDHQHLVELREQLGSERIDSELDVPVSPGFDSCCPFEFVEL